MSSVATTMLISQVPLDVIGGGELFTIRSFEQLARQNSGSELWYAETVQCPTADHPQRMQQWFTRATLDGESVVAQERLPLRDLLNRLAEFDVLAVHQYLSTGSTIDMLAALAPDQHAVLTSLGHEPFTPFFSRVFEPASNVHIVEISEYAADRARQRGHVAVGVAAGIFERTIQNPRAVTASRSNKAIGLGRLLPHKGFDVTIAGLPKSWNLTIVGPPSGDSVYEELLAEMTQQQENISLVGFQPQRERERLLAEADALVASSTQTLYDGRYLEQAELFGLVLLEAVAAGVIPVASDLPSFREIMETLGLEQFLYAERNSQQLQQRLSEIEKLPEANRESCLRAAQHSLREHYLWESYWNRVFAQLPPVRSRPRIHAKLVA